MADRSKIEWTESTWNPVVGCTIVSPGCTNCYAMKMADRIEGIIVAHIGTHGGDPGPMFHYEDTTTRGDIGTKPPVWTGKVALAPDRILLAPLRWKQPRRVFVNSMGDLFHESVPDAWIDQVFAIMALCPQHTFQVLTKRSARMRAYLTTLDLQERIIGAASDIASGAPKLVRSGGHIAVRRVNGVDRNVGPWPLPNVWIGVSAEDQRRADDRVPDLLATPAAVRFVSAEPLLGMVDLRHLAVASNVSLNALTGQFTATARLSGSLADFQAGLDALPPLPSRRPALNWIIVGGESGRGARPMHPDWARRLRDQCAAAGVPFFFKQWGEWTYTHPRWPQAVPTVMANDGTIYAPCDLAYPDGARYGEAIRAGHDKAHLTNIYLVGRKVSGRLLDGVEHNGMPDRSPALAGAA